MVDDVDLREMRGIIINTMGTNEENAGKLPWTPGVILIRRNKEAYFLVV